MMETDRFALINVVFVSLDTPDSLHAIGDLRNKGCMVLALATIAQKRQRMAALAAGAHEFLTTGPIDPAQLSARLTLLATGSALPAGIAMDAGQGSLLLAGASHQLSERDYRLIAMLVEARGGVVSHDALLERVWDGRYTDRQHLRVAIRRLRKRIEPEPDLPRYLLSEPAIGYRFGNGGDRRMPPAA